MMEKKIEKKKWITNYYTHKNHTQYTQHKNKNEDKQMKEKKKQLHKLIWNEKKMWKYIVIIAKTFFVLKFLNEEKKKKI